jgi:VWFA-related protein
VQVDVVVTDGDDQPIRDLDVDDFELFEEGRRQQIAEFRFVSIPPASRNVERATSTPLRDVISNEPLKDGRLFVLVIDDLHITLDAEKFYRLKQIIVPFLSGLSPADQVAVVYASRSDLSQDFTSDLASQVRALDHLKAGLQPRGITDLTARHDIRSSLFVLRNVCKALAGSPHPRRAIVYIGEALPAVHTPDLRSYLFDAFNASRQSNVPIYAIDPRGLLTIGGIEHVSGQRRQKDSLHVLAINTGGRAFVEQSSLPRAAEQIVVENGSFYMLGYYPDPLIRDGKLHDIDVRVKRPGVRVRARQAYVAPGPLPPKTTAALPAEAGSHERGGDSPGGSPVAPELADDLGRGVTMFGVPLRGFAAPVARGERGRVKTVLTLEVSYPSMGTAPVTDELRYGLLAVDHDARPLASSAKTLAFKAPRPGAATYVIHDAVELPPGPSTIRAAVASRALGKTGTLHLPVSVPKVHDDRLALTPLVLGLRGQGSPAQSVLAAWLPFEPTTARTFARSDVLRIFGRLFWRERDGKAVSVTTTLRQGDRVAHRQERALDGDSAPNRRREASLSTELPLEQLSPGAYTLDVEARLAGGTSVRRAVAFEIQ